jgi:serine/threonine-protein kinase
MAEIYRATDVTLARDVAVKVLAEHQAEDEEIRARFLQEGLAAARLSGEPNTVAVYDVGETDGRPFIVMEHLSGGSLASQLQDGPVQPDLALDWLEQAARALDVAHTRGVVHRDIKPGNLLLDEQGNVHVADFGIARADGLDSNTQTGIVLGTAGYLAPEQAAGDGATPASDRYALAVVAHELLTGTRQWVYGGLPPALDAVFARALSERPEERFDTSLEFVSSLRAAFAAGDASTVAAGTPRRRRRAPAFIAGLIALGLLGYVLVTGFSAEGGKSPKPRSPSVVVRTVTIPPRTTSTSQPVAQEAGGQAESPKGKRHGPHGKKGEGKG